MQEFVLRSPEGKVELKLRFSDGKLFWQVSCGGTAVTDPSPLGLVLPDLDLSEGLSFAGEARDSIDETYSIPAFRKAVCANRANTIALSFEKEGRTLVAEGRAYDDGAAVRLVLCGEGEGAVDHETTGFAVPEAVDFVYGMKWICHYEDHYHPIPKEDLYQNICAFPVLVKAGPKTWALYAEADVFDYCGSNLQSEKDEPGLLRVCKAPDQVTPMTAELPMKTPWRVVICGGLDDIVDTNILENLNPPSIIDDPSFIRPGMAAWSWMSEHMSARDPERQRDFVDFAADMGWPYSLVDGGWPDHVDIPELVKYAEEKNVKIMVWAHRMQMMDPEAVDEKMKLWSSWGVVGIKIDFFESDSQKRVAQYKMLAETAAKYRLMLVFHGCIRPSGLSRVWPHVVSYEAVMGAEYLAGFSGFEPMGPDAAHNCMLPFTRNVMGPMDYTPVCYESYVTATTDPHQTALPVIFTSYVTHCGEGKEKVERNVCAPFLKKLRTTWDESKLLEGSPASYVTMARRSGDEWFVAGICARRPREARLKLDFLTADEYTAEIYRDDLSDMRPTDVARWSLGQMTPEMVAVSETVRAHDTQHQHDLHKVKVETFAVKKGEELTVPMSVNGGFAMILTPAGK